MCVGELKEQENALLTAMLGGQHDSALVQRRVFNHLQKGIVTLVENAPIDNR